MAIYTCLHLFLACPILLAIGGHEKQDGCLDQMHFTGVKLTAVPVIRAVCSPIGKHIAVLVDCDQKDIYQVENGNRQLVTIIETVSTDGKALHPSIIYQGKHRDLEWGHHNPCNARSV